MALRAAGSSGISSSIAAAIGDKRLGAHGECDGIASYLDALSLGGSLRPGSHINGVPYCARLPLCPAVAQSDLPEDQHSDDDQRSQNESAHEKPLDRGDSTIDS